MPIAITRAVSPNLNRCELGYLPREPIDVARAAAQHHQYEQALQELGIEVFSLPAEPDLPDSMFVEDPAVVVPEVGVVTRMGAESRRAESNSLAQVLLGFRPLVWMQAPATLEGGDVLRVGKTLFVGLSARTNAEGVAQLSDILGSQGYSVKSVAVRGCLHLKSGACAIGDRLILANPQWVDTAAFAGFEIVPVPREEPRAANVLAIDGTVLMPACFPATARLVEGLGWKVRTLDISELMKAEAGVTCSSILLDAG